MITGKNIFCVLGIAGFLAFSANNYAGSCTCRCQLKVFGNNQILDTQPETKATREACESSCKNTPLRFKSRAECENSCKSLPVKSQAACESSCKSYPVSPETYKATCEARFK